MWNWNVSIFACYKNVFFTFTSKSKRNHVFSLLLIFLYNIFLYNYVNIFIKMKTSLNNENEPSVCSFEITCRRRFDGVT